LSDSYVFVNKIIGHFEIKSSTLQPCSRQALQIGFASHFFLNLIEILSSAQKISVTDFAKKSKKISELEN
jgi:hypothetical protein